MRSAGSRLGLLLAAFGLLHASAVAAETKNVLLLFSNARLLPANVNAERGLRETFAKSTDRRVELYAEFLDAPHFAGEAYNRTVAMYLREKYASRPPDAIVAADARALGLLVASAALAQTPSNSGPPEAVPGQEPGGGAVSVHDLAAAANNPAAPTTLLQFCDVLVPHVPGSTGAGNLFQIQPVLPILASHSIQPFSFSVEGGYTAVRPSSATPRWLIGIEFTPILGAF